MSDSWKPIIVFFVLTILVLSLIPILSITTGATMDFDASAARATEKTGIEQTSNLLVVIRLAVAEPALWLLILGSCVPFLAAILTCLIFDPTEIQRIIGRLRPVLPGVSTASALKAYLFLFIIIPIVLLIIFGIRQIIPGDFEYIHADNILGPGFLAALLLSAFVDQGGVLEELGWRGFGQPNLQEKLLTPLNAALVIGLAWGLWHVPRDVVGGVVERLGFVQYLLIYLPSFVLGTLSTSIIIGYFMNRTGGSVLPAIMIHGLTNDAVGIAGEATMAIALAPYHQLTQNIPFAIFAGVLVGLYGKELGRGGHGSRVQK
jgi:hypothetical protein